MKGLLNGISAARWMGYNPLDVGDSIPVLRAQLDEEKEKSAATIATLAACQQAAQKEGITLPSPLQFPETQHQEQKSLYQRLVSAITSEEAKKAAIVTAKITVVVIVIFGLIAAAAATGGLAALAIIGGAGLAPTILFSGTCAALSISGIFAGIFAMKDRMYAATTQNLADIGAFLLDTAAVSSILLYHVLGIVIRIAFIELLIRAYTGR